MREVCCRTVWLLCFFSFLILACDSWEREKTKNKQLFLASGSNITHLTIKQKKPKANTDKIFFVKSMGLKVWSKPYLQGKEIGLLENSESVKILQTTTKPEILGQKQGQWVKIQTIPNQVSYLDKNLQPEEAIILEGWVFDAYLAADSEGPLALIHQAQTLEKEQKYTAAMKIYLRLKQEFPLKLIQRGESTIRVLDLVQDKEKVLTCRENGLNTPRHNSPDKLIDFLTGKLKENDWQSLQSLAACEMQIGLCELCMDCGIYPEKAIQLIEDRISMVDLTRKRVSLSSPKFIKYAFPSLKDNGEFILTIKKLLSQKWQWIGFCYSQAGVL